MVAHWTEKQKRAVSKPGAAGLAPGRPDEGVWAYVCVATAPLNAGKTSFLYCSSVSSSSPHIR